VFEKPDAGADIEAAGESTLEESSDSSFTRLSLSARGFRNQQRRSVAVNLLFACHQVKEHVGQRFVFRNVSQFIECSFKLESTTKHQTEAVTQTLSLI
jgi:hypothetical protein